MDNGEGKEEEEERIKVNLRMKQKTPFDTNSNAVNDAHAQWRERLNYYLLNEIDSSGAVLSQYIVLDT